jgi:2-polyprenyl-6-hydroxyphenyl methylase/3-demethylubiquinone-9 3-methyltransferase
VSFEVNNQVYRELGEKWYAADDDPIALLRAENRFRLSWLKSEFKNSDPLSILDVGCGAGLLANPLALDGHKIWGVDQADEALEVARRHDVTGKVQYRSGQAEALPFADQLFDVVCCFDVLEHVTDPRAVVRECSRVLKPGGRFYFFTFNRTALSYIIGIKALEWFLKNTPSHLHVHQMFIRPEELEQICVSSGLTVELLSGFGPRIFQTGMLDLIFKGRVRSDFEFELKRSKAVSYLGKATRIEAKPKVRSEWKSERRLET